MVRDLEAFFVAEAAFLVPFGFSHGSVVDLRFRSAPVFVRSSPWKNFAPERDFFAAGMGVSFFDRIGQVARVVPGGVAPGTSRATLPRSNPAIGATR
ncbi:MAG TPA: hypothetical protein VJM11_15890 [Nevskiaceae bacterium]|nr:hypothetical protein [Nevskiaceae bacterium]